MKKVLLSGVVCLLAACSSNQSNCPCTSEEPHFVIQETVPFLENASCACGCSNQMVEVIPEIIEVNPCKCASVIDNTREVLRPRITEVVKEEARRNCPKDSQILNCGCGNCDTFAQEKEKTVSEVKEVVPAMPEAYELAASRVFNRFVKETTEIYGAKPNVLLYFEAPDIKSEDLPKGIEKGVLSFKNKVLTSYTYAVTDDENNHDYLIKTEADWFDTPSKTVPAIKYTVTLFNKDNKQIGQWIEVVKKADNSLKWL